MEEEPEKTAVMSEKSADLLFEIGVEEIPAGYLDAALAQIRAIASNGLEKNRLSFEEIRALATPRRLTLCVKGVATTQSDNVSEVVGPPKRVAYDENGEPTKAAIGFSKTQGVDVADLEDCRDGTRRVCSGFQAGKRWRRH